MPADYPAAFGPAFTAPHGIEGVLREELLDMSAQIPGNALLANDARRRGIGTCCQLKEHQQEDFQRWWKFSKRTT